MKHRVCLLLASTVIGSLIAVFAITTCHRIALYRPVYRVLNPDKGVDNPWEFVRRNYYLTDCQADRICEVLREHGEFHFRMFNICQTLEKYNELHFRVFNFVFISRQLYDDPELLWNYTGKSRVFN